MWTFPLQICYSFSFGFFIGWWNLFLCLIYVYYISY